MTNCAEHLVQHLSSFYKGILQSYAYVNQLDVRPNRPWNIWAIELVPKVNKSLITLGYIQIGDLPTASSVIDYWTIQIRAQQHGITDNLFLVCTSLQEKLKPFLNSEVHELSFPAHLPHVAKKLLLTEWQHLVSLVKWEIVFQRVIPFDKQQQAFHNMLHTCKINKFKEVNFKLLHGILVTLSLLAKIKKNKELAKCFCCAQVADLGHIMLGCESTRQVHEWIITDLELDPP